MSRKRKDEEDEEEEEEGGEEEKEKEKEEKEEKKKEEGEGEKRRWRGKQPTREAGNKETLHLYADQPGVMKLYEGDEDVKISMKALNSDFSCPVCLGIIKKAMVVTQCMHRFCEECISNSLRLGNKECPKCRAKCASKRHLRPDKEFDKLLLSIIKDVDQFEDEQLRIVQKVNTSAKLTGNSEKISEGIFRQAKNRSKRLTKQDMEDTPMATPPRTTASTPSPQASKKRERERKQRGAEKEIQHHPQETPMKKQKKSTKQPLIEPEIGNDHGPVCWTYYQHNKTRDPIVVPNPPLNTSSLITIYLQKHPQSSLTRLERPWLTLSKSAKVEVLNNFVNKKHGTNDPLSFFLHDRDGFSEIKEIKNTLQSLVQPWDGPYITLYYNLKE